MPRFHPLAVAAALAAALPAAASAATPEIQIQAHRGGTYVDGRPTFPEATLPAFVAAAELGVTLEMDIQMTKDGVPVVLHDDTLDRTTNCTGPVAERTAKQLRRDCRVDKLGVADNDLGMASRTIKRGYEIPTLLEVLTFARKAKRPVSVELKQFDPTGASARAFAKAVRRSKLPVKRVIAQSFFPPNLEAVSKALPGVATSVLTITAGNASSIEIARGIGARWVSPQWPVDAAYVEAAHAAGLKVVPFTLDHSDEIRAAKAAGVDAVITDDPTMARWALR